MLGVVPKYSTAAKRGRPCLLHPPAMAACVGVSEKRKSDQEAILCCPLDDVLGFWSEGCREGSDFDLSGGKGAGQRGDKELGLRGESVGESGSRRSSRFWCERLRETSRALERASRFLGMG